METDTLVIGTKCTSNVNLSPSRALIDAQVLRQIRNVCDCWLRRYTQWWSLLFVVKWKNYHKNQKRVAFTKLHTLS